MIKIKTTTMIDIKTKYEDLKKIPFPDDLKGVEIHGIDLVLLDCDTAGLIDKFISYKGQLNHSDYDKLKHCYVDLKSVTRELQGEQRLYFSSLLNIAHLTIDFLKSTQRFIRDKEQERLINNWKDDYIKIRDILNDWDILGVADLVDDEYDSINFMAYSALTNNGGLDEIKTVIKKYVNESMELDISENELTKLAEKIMTIKK